MQFKVGRRIAGSHHMAATMTVLEYGGLVNCWSPFHSKKEMMIEIGATRFAGKIKSGGYVSNGRHFFY